MSICWSIFPTRPSSSVSASIPCSANIAGLSRDCARCFLIGAGVWTREELAHSEATWTLAERLHRSGISSNDIFADASWLFYWNFDDYFREVAPETFTGFSDVFNRWIPQRRAAARYRIVHELKPPADEKWVVLDRFRYFSVFSRGMETFYAVRRDAIFAGATRDAASK